jgi:hypothetical protein
MAELMPELDPPIMAEIYVEKEITPEPMPRSLDPEPLNPNDSARQEKIDRIRRMGGVASAFAAPAKPLSEVARRPSDVYEKIESSSSSGVAMSPISISGDPVLARLDALEKSIIRKLDLMSGGGSECQIMISGIASLSAQVKEKEEELERLKREIDEERSRPVGQVEVQMLENVKRESESVRRASAGAEKSLKESEVRVREIETKISQHGAAAQARAKTLVKRLMENVFQEMNETFEARKQYSGNVVSGRLGDLLRKHSYVILKDIQENGLF